MVIQWWHIVIVLLVAFLIFGAKSLPELGRSLGKSISEFRKGTKEAADSFKEEILPNNNTPASTAQSTTPANAPAGGGNFCINCGASNVPGARFCANCGSKLPEKTA